MKMHEIRKEYGLRQTTFYYWLRETGMIEKTNQGYIVGKNALEGMETLETKRVDANGEIQINTQVKMNDARIPTLIELYEQSGLLNLYSGKKAKTIELEQRVQLKKELSRAVERISILENQILILTKQLEVYMKIVN